MPARDAETSRSHQELNAETEHSRRLAQAQSKTWVTMGKLIARLPPRLRSKRRLNELVALKLIPVGKCPLTGRPLFDLHAVLATVDRLIANGVIVPAVVFRKTHETSS